MVVPAYNEEERLPDTLIKLCAYYDAQAYDYDVLIVSDGSNDETGLIVREFSELNPNFQLLEYHPNRGKGYAVRAGMLAARGDYLLFCDADSATPQEETEKLLAAIKSGADVAFGSRPMKDSKLEIRQPWYREFLGRSFNFAVQTLSVRGVNDTQCGFKIFRREVARDIFTRCKFDGFSFDFEALMIGRDLGYRLDEVPIRWMHQEGSKVSLLRDGLRMLRDLIRLRSMGKARRLAIREP